MNAAVQGRLQIGENEKHSEKRVSRGVIADQALALRRPPKVRKLDPEAARTKKDAPREVPFEETIPF